MKDFYELPIIGPQRYALTGASSGRHAIVDRGESGERVRIIIDGMTADTAAIIEIEITPEVAESILVGLAKVAAMN